MAADPARKADTKQWLRKADEDLKAAKQLLSGSKPLLGAALFHLSASGGKLSRPFSSGTTCPSAKSII
jgi:hypothetical protein